MNCTHSSPNTIHESAQTQRKFRNTFEDRGVFDSHKWYDLFMKGKILVFIKNLILIEIAVFLTWIIITVFGAMVGSGISGTPYLKEFAGGVKGFIPFSTNYIYIIILLLVTFLISKRELDKK